MKTIYVFYCLLCATWTEGKSISVEGFERGEVSFQCSHKVAWLYDKYLCQDPCKGHQDKLLTVGSGKRAESGRITLVDLGNGAFTVTFSQLQLSDTGRYWCGVDRPGFDTFTEVQLTVKEAANETTTTVPGLSPTWTYQFISNSTELLFGTVTSRPTNFSTASNCTDGGEQNICTGAVLYATVGVVSVLAILMLAMCFRKYRGKSKPQQQVCSNTTDVFIADESEDDRVYDEIAEEVQSLKKCERFFSTQTPKQDPPTSATTEAECSTPLHIYENICCSKVTADSRCSAAGVQGKHGSKSSGVYIQLLPSTISERTDESSVGEHKNKPSATRKSTSKATESREQSGCHSRSRSDSTEGRPKSRWFGLDLSGTV